MEQITAFKGLDGKVYFSEEECFAADKKYEASDGKKKQLMYMTNLVSAIIPDGKWHKLEVEYKDKCFYIRKKVTKKEVGFEIGFPDEGFPEKDEVATNTMFIGNHIKTFVNPTYEENERGFCDNSLRDILSPLFWNRPDVWEKALCELLDQRIVEKNIARNALELEARELMKAKKELFGDKPWVLG